MAFDVMTGNGLGAQADELQQQLKTLFERAVANQKLQQDQQRIDIEQRQQQDQADYKRAYLRSLDEQREATARLRDEQGADRLAPHIAPGSVLDAATRDVLSRGGYGGSAFVDHQAATLPSTAMQGAAQLTGAAPRIVGLVQKTNPGHPDQDVWRGTAQQQQEATEEAAARALMNDPSTPVSMRNYLQLQLASRGRLAIPTAALPVQDRPILQQLPDGTLVNLGNYAGNARVINAPKPTVDPAARAAAKAAADDPQFPRGVQAYVSQLRGKYQNFNDAQQELSQAMTSLQQAHPSLSPVKVQNALRQQYAGAGKPSGDALLEALLTAGPGAAGGAPRIVGGRVVGSSGGRGAVPAGSAGAAGPPAVDRTVTRDELAAIAQRRGTSVEQEAQRAAAAGFVVR